MCVCACMYKYHWPTLVSTRRLCTLSMYPSLIQCVKQVMSV